jgi:5-methylcytosine-specific restriction endonuclease McrA
LLVVDRIMPKAHGGKATRKNSRLACVPCYRSRPRCGCPDCMAGLSLAPKRKKLMSYLLARDGNICSICGELMDATGRYPNTQRAASIDHVIPRSHGGNNALSNLRLAHRKCNANREDRDCPACATGHCPGRVTVPRARNMEQHP